MRTCGLNTRNTVSDREGTLPTALSLRLLLCLAAGLYLFSIPTMRPEWLL